MDYDRCVQGVSEGSFPNCIRMDELEMLRHAWAVDSGTNCTKFVRICTKFLRRS